MSSTVKFAGTSSKTALVPTFYHYAGFPGNACISLNEEVIHGIPGGKLIRSGDIVSVDVGAKVHGFTGDCAGTYPCGEITPEAADLIAVTRQSFFEGIRYARPGCRISDIGHAIQEYVESHGYSVVRRIRRTRCGRRAA